MRSSIFKPVIMGSIAKYMHYNPNKFAGENSKVKRIILVI